MTDFDVIVVGGGPSGLTTAAEIARTGASVVVLEKRAVEPVPRAGTLLPRPLELFERGEASQIDLSAGHASSILIHFKHGTFGGHVSLTGLNAIPVSASPFFCRGTRPK